jgi:hypothetical protein
MKRKGFSMKKEQVFGIVRTLAAAAFGYAAGRGFIDSATAEHLAGAVATIGVAVWSVLSKAEPTEAAE